MEAKTYTCAIVDDDEIDRLTIYSYCLRQEGLKVAGTFSNPVEALAFILKNPVDILFLDIDMPEMNGIELRRHLPNIPVCIFITSHPEFALESYDLYVLDYLIKPVPAGRFETCMERVMQYLSVIKKAALLDHTVGEDNLFIKDGHHQHKVQLQDIIYLEALKDYTSIVTLKKKYCVLSSLGQILKDPPFKNFIRIHRSYAVQKHYITKISTHELLVQNIALPIGRSYKELLKF